MVVVARGVQSRLAATSSLCQAVAQAKRPAEAGRFEGGERYVSYVIYGVKSVGQRSL